MKKPKVSVIIPTYKRPERVERALVSVLNQDYENFEVVVVDDNNPDTKERKLTQKVMNKYLNYPNVFYIQHDKNRNGAAARNTGVKNSSGEFITFLDDDDEYYPTKIRKQVAQLSSLDDSWGINYSNYDKIDQYGNKVTSAEKAEGYLKIRILSKNLFIGSGSNFMVRRSVLEEVKGFDESFMRNQDLEFLVKVSQNYKIKHLDETLFLIHGDTKDKDFSFDEIMDIHNKYRDTFQNEINSLDVNEKNEVNKLLDLWDIRLAITHKKYKIAYQIYRESNLCIKEVLVYIKYLLKRFLYKESYGFTLYSK